MYLGKAGSHSGSSIFQRETIIFAIGVDRLTDWFDGRGVVGLCLSAMKRVVMLNVRYLVGFLW